MVLNKQAGTEYQAREAGRVVAGKDQDDLHLFLENRTPDRGVGATLPVVSPYKAKAQPP